MYLLDLLLQVSGENKDHPLASNMTHKDTSCDDGESREGSEESDVGGAIDDEEGGAIDDEEGGGFSGIRMQSVKDIIAKARFAESYLRGGTDVGENLEELAQMIQQEPKEEEGRRVCTLCVHGLI